MKLEPVYLLAPEPEEPQRRRFRRRTLLFGTFGALALGAAGGWSLRKVLAPSSSGAGDATDPVLQWALRLQDGDEEALVANAENFVLAVLSSSDRRLLTGLERLADLVLDETRLPAAKRREIARRLVAVIEQDPDARALAPRLDALRAIR